MREQIAAPRRLVSQGRPEIFGLHGDENEVLGTGEVAGRGLGHLGGGGEMDVAVGCGRSGRPSKRPIASALRQRARGQIL